MVRSGYRSWGQVGGRSRLGVQVGGQGLGRGQGFGVKVGVKVVVKVGGQGQGSRSWGQGQRHDWWSQGLGSRSGVNVRGQGQGSGQGHGEVVNTWRIGVRWSGGKLEINSLFLSRTHERIEFHSIPIHSIPFHSIPCFTQCHTYCIPTYSYYHSLTFNIHNFIIFLTIFCCFKYTCKEIIKYFLKMLQILLKSREISRSRSGPFSLACIHV